MSGPVEIYENAMLAGPADCVLDFVEVADFNQPIDAGEHVPTIARAAGH